MPSSNYRRKLRNNSSNRARFISLPATIKSIHATDDIERLEKYFLSVIEMVTQYQNLDTFKSILNNIKDYVSPMVYYTKIMENIQSILLNILENITDGSRSGFIQLRLNYIKEQLTLVPLKYQQYDKNTSLTILRIIDTIIDDLDFKSIKDTLNDVKFDLNEKNQEYILYRNIQANLIDVITNIENGVPAGTIQLRTDYLKSLM